ncbi:MAG TPA: HEAT repeat domain-containing protein [Planctomycetota bacterium]|nr:HEAT repeat domain-containing protein [Planctomycetota bacterium]
MSSFRLASSVLALSLFAAPAFAQEPAGAPSPAENPPQVVAATQSHYRAVLDELSAADVSHLGAAQQGRRAQMLAELRDYCERGVFGVNRNPDTVREPYFVDGTGRLCAVANLIATCGQRPLVDQVAATANNAYVVELAQLPALLEWLDSVGLTVEEIARIQDPATAPHSGDPTFVMPAPEPGANWPGAVSSPSGTWGAGNQPGANNAMPSRSSSSSSSGTGADGNGRTTSRGPSGRQGDLRSGLAWEPNGSEEDWWLWWEMNKLRFLKPHRLAAPLDAAAGRITRVSDDRGTATDTLGARIADSAAATARAELLPLLVALTQSEDALLRARAAATLGRLGGREAVAPLTALLSDNQVLVRHAAIVGLGATGSMEAAKPLLSIAADGGLQGPDGPQLSSWARPLAFVALGLGRRHGMSPVLDGFVADLAREAAAQRPELGTAALLYQTLSPCEPLSEYALAVLDDERAASDLRCRAAETLGLAGDAAELPRLTHLLGDGQVEMRRSAALAMSGLSHPLALAALKTAYEMEAEPTARGFLLLAVAEQGGDGAREFLIRAARGGPQTSRPWAALGLGLLARSLDDSRQPAGQPAYAEICATLREGLGSDVNHGARGAWILAAGIARDAGSVPRLRETMTGSKDQRIRMFAALSLAMIGDAGSRALMLEQLRHEDAPLAIVGLTQALGAFGVAEDGPALAAAVREMRVPSTQVLLAVALAFHGSEPALEGLLAIIRDESASSEARAAAVDGLGLLLDERSGLMLQEVAAAANFYVFPDWVNGMLTSFTL